MTVTTSAQFLTVEQVRAIPDPVERVAAAAALGARHTERAEEARKLRDHATIVAHLDDNVPPVTLYRDTLQCSRTLFVRIIQRAPTKENRPYIQDALAVAAECSEAVRRHKAIVAEAQEIRNETSMLLMNGGTDPVSGKRIIATPNADVARATGLSTARVAQVRTGTR